MQSQNRKRIPTYMACGFGRKPKISILKHLKCCIPNSFEPNLWNSLTFLISKISLTNLQNSLTFPWPWRKMKFPWLFPDKWPPWKGAPNREFYNVLGDITRWLKNLRSYFRRVEFDYFFLFLNGREECLFYSTWKSTCSVCVCGGGGGRGTYWSRGTYWGEYNNT